MTEIESEGVGGGDKRAERGASKGEMTAQQEDIDNIYYIGCVSLYKMFIL